MSDVTLREAPLRFTSNLGEGDEARKADTLNLLPYAEALRDFIHDCDTPMTIGIQGDWGIGRTSLMNMLRGNGNGGQSGLLDSGLCKAINLDSWPYSQFDQDDNMVAACLYALTQELGRALSTESSIDETKLKTLLEAANHKLVIVMEQIRELVQGQSAGSRDGKSYIDISGQMLQFRSDFAELVSLWAESGEDRRVSFLSMIWIGYARPWRWNCSKPSRILSMWKAVCS